MNRNQTTATQELYFPEGHDAAAEAHLAAVALVQQDTAIREAVKARKFQALRQALIAAKCPREVWEAYCSAENAAWRSPHTGYSRMKWETLVEVIETWLLESAK